MNDTIIQFEGFETNIEQDEFVAQWEPYAKQFATKDTEVTLQQSNTKNNFKYVSQHKCKDTDFQFVFMKGRMSEHFPKGGVKVVQAGGYMPVQIEHVPGKNKKEIKLMLFLSHAQTDISAYQKLTCYRCLNVYQAYYESCMYGYILEFFLDEAQTSELMKKIESETKNYKMGIYKSCLTLS